MKTRCRLFFALEPDEMVRTQVQSIQKAQAVDGRPVDPVQFHITLAFLGMQPAEVIPGLTSMASNLEWKPCRVILDRIGFFRKAGVMWLGSSSIPANLQAFQHSLIDGIEQIGVDRDRKPWKLHLTLYRRLRMLPPIIDPVPVIWSLEGFSLVESVSVKGGVEYHRHGHWTGSC